MGKIKEREFTDFDDDESLLEESEALTETDLDIADGAADLLEEEIVQSRRTWRDTEKYKEMRELYKIINDELYIGFDIEEFLEDEY
ncbi:MAG: hypothetical protein A3I13_05505 [Gammaproteobacteria bacterium RIFCSPLOWO2_02_FULL_47_50]|jgi:hypothetical protein|nr:MAG: hypothetical protein A2W69_02180 [Gammaproteobacteria bacterium RIFCSPLOWO2_02_47_7]OGT66696.1 MAG: hypothetical protein A2993_03120 [Gammaproteobacteria bacterium RIFCSPLOWO2_01_FULL_47_190]OGT76386.1 MAG: hypothetical protein A2W76_09430 [Gammaproteobacteria bacterium RIFCSPLOWO2_12_47_11]OGT79240.1 MAG: hypothetical protein A3I13_05505 [Gammaproteobacteria bacterium RIFCSPLOWO2_02_FULL_47_50]OGT82955.1 MAG: hypothetical protein A3G42_06055 [Gammaproteobacteria bacterium RIFCSPLOWO2_1